MKIYPLILLILICGKLLSQPVLIDEGVQAEGLICFPVYGDSLRYKYLPSQGRLSLDKNSLPEFSFLRFAFESKDEKISTSTISDANGGGIVHFLVLYDTPEEQIRKAQSTLRNKLKRKLVLDGPVPFSRGQYLVVSSVLQDNKEKQVLLLSGDAPVFENSKVAFSFSLTPKQSQILMESFKMKTPDISIVFDLVFSGLTQAYQAELEVDWSQVEKTEYSKESIDAFFYSKDVEKNFGELIKTGAIKIRSAGKDSTSEELLTLVYDKLLKLMFEPTKPTLLPQDQTGGFLEDVLGNRGLGSLIGFGGSDVYKKREIRTSGKTVVTINSRYNADRHHFVTFNIGDLYQKYGEDKTIFKDVAIEDMTFQQRDVYVSIDGSLTGEFDKMINSVSVVLKKTHANGEALINQNVLKDYKGSLSMSYLNHQEPDRDKWLEYQYQVAWQFKGGGQYTTDWMTANQPIINLFAPYKYHEIYLEGNWGKLSSEGVQAVSIQIKYDFFGQGKTARQTLRAGGDNVEKKFDLVLPNNIDEVEYTLSWIKNNHPPRNASGTDRFGIIFWDEIPK
jgi:hypothetical protein